MARESRGAPRKTIQTPGFLYTIDGWPICECRMLDASDGGARIKLAGAEDLPEEFLLSLSRDGKVRRRCELRWRKDNTLGVRFKK